MALSGVSDTQGFGSGSQYLANSGREPINKKAISDRIEFVHTITREQLTISYNDPYSVLKIYVWF